jgi:phenylalanyl-tRNA synthetase beta chain
MASLTLNKEEIKKITGEITDENLDMLLGLFSTASEKITNTEVVVEVAPNRPDLLSAHGFIRAFRVFLGKETGVKKYKITKSDAKIIVDKATEKVRPYSMAAIVRGVKFTDQRIKEIMQWQEKIHGTVGRNRKKVALGYYDLNKIKFPVKYILKTPKEIIFEPLDMPQKMNALEILSRHPCGRDFGNQLQGFEKFPVYYDANNEVLSVPPIINSNNSGKIIPGISDVLIECSGYDISTLKKVITMAVVDLIDLGGKAYSVDVVYGGKKEFIDLKPEKMKVSLENINKLLGLNLKEKDLEKLLPKMGYDYKNGRVLVPAWRTDIMHEVDIIEDIAIAYGYDKIIPEIPKVATIGEESAESKVERKISEILTGLGLIETSSYHLIKNEEAKIMKIEDKIELENSKTEYKILRPNLIVPALRTFSENKDNEYPQKVFEIGSVFEKGSTNLTETGIKESKNLIIALSPGDFTGLKQILDYLIKMLGLCHELKESKVSGFIEGRVGNVIINKKECGFIGEVHPETLREWSIKMPVVALEISLEEIFKMF